MSQPIRASKEYAVQYKGHEIVVVFTEENGLVSSCVYRIDDWSPRNFDTALPVGGLELREDAVLMAKAEIDRLPG